VVTTIVAVYCQIYVYIFFLHTLQYISTYLLDL
jgi:hypothetical protein